MVLTTKKGLFKPFLLKNMDFLNKLLNYYNITLDEYNLLRKKITLNDVPYISNFKNVEECKKLVDKCINTGEKILIYGDYDCDGVMAVSILKCAFNKINYDNVGYYIPSRYKDGYGLTLANAEKFHKLEYKLIICVDNGVSQFEAIDYCLKNEIDIIICDHHEILNEKLLKVNTIIHPYFSNLKEACSGAYTSFILASSILGKFDEYLFSMATISIISDLMVLKNENRNIVKYGLEIINKNKYLQFLLLSKDTIIDENTISGQIAPKINSVGRLVEDLNVNLIAKFFISEDKNEIYKILNFIERINNERKEISSKFDISKVNNENDIIIELFDVKEGIIGLLANKIMDEYKKPVLIFCKTNEDSVLKGSIRSKFDINVLELFKPVEKLLLTYGGHDYAGGLSVKMEDYDIFKQTLNNYIKGKHFKHEEKESINIGLNEITKENFLILKKFGPFGYGNEMPFFKVSGFKVNAFNYSRNKEHIITRLSNYSKIIAFNYDENILDHNKVDFIGKFKLEVYNGYENIDFMINEFIY